MRELSQTRGTEARAVMAFTNMTMRLLTFFTRQHALRLAAFLGGLICSIAFPEICKAAPPQVTVQPVGGFAGVGEDFVFTAEAAGDTPLSYQWLLNNKKLANRTNSTLLLTNLTSAQAGNYSVLVTNAFGKTNSTIATLIVQTTPSRRLGTGRIIQNGSQAGVPISLRANGREHALSFSLQYDPNAFANPVFQPANGAASVTVTQNAPGLVGVALTLPPGEMFEPGYPWIGLFQFDLSGTSGPLNGNLLFATNPLPIAVINTNGKALSLSAGIDPQYVIVNSTPVLNPQTGLFEQQILVSNPSGVTNSDVQIFPVNLGMDSRSNAIRLQNAQGTSATAPQNDVLPDVGCDCACGFRLDGPATGCDFSTYLACGIANCANLGTNFSDLRFARISTLLPGESRLLTMEFYVTDHVTAPDPLYAVYFTGGHLQVKPPVATVLEITNTRMTNGHFLVEFPTQLGRTYYIQYASSAADLATTNSHTVLPSIQGTGSRIQWLDTGPPKTETPPESGSRFYRVLEVQ